ncbi:hypothetical protein TNCV_4064241 [Trichonephila clavipes]|nr:hypothetical protein TNCV_4064241 [Trichonephila clavipes]
MRRITRVPRVRESPVFTKDSNPAGSIVMGTSSAKPVLTKEGDKGGHYWVARAPLSELGFEEPGIMSIRSSSSSGCNSNISSSIRWDF